MQQLIEDYYHEYLSLLRELCARPSVFTEPDSVKALLAWIEKKLEEFLPHYEIIYDAGHNLIARPPKLNEHQSIVYLSAHADTVGAAEEEWDKPFRPFVPFEDSDELVARGVNDCKAGVAYQLFLAFLAGKDQLKLNNLLFTFTFKEEGAGHKSAVEIGKSLGVSLPLGKPATYLLVLENTVIVSAVPSLCLYTSERGNFVVQVSGSISQLQNYLRILADWNPVSIAPQQELPGEDLFLQEQAGGHICSLEPEENLLTRVILQASEKSLLLAGESENFGTIPCKITSGKSKTAVEHTLVLSKRSFDSADTVREQLSDIPYTPIKDFSYSAGFSIEERWEEFDISRVITTIDNADIPILQTFNPGISDASTIYQSTNPQYRPSICPLVIGPGSRSQRESKPPRLTHGKNETFDKKSGKKALVLISNILKDLGVLSSS